MLERTMAQGLRSKLFDMLSLVLIGLMRFDTKDSKGLKYSHDAMVQELERRPQSKRLAAIRSRVPWPALSLRAQGRQRPRAGPATEPGGRCRGLRPGGWRACWLASGSVLSKLAIQLDEMGPIISKMGLRFCTSKASSELLVSVSEDNETVANEFRSCHTRIFGVAETAMRHSMRGSARTGVELLIQQGEATRNSKLIDMASLVLKRHAEKIDDAEQLAEQIRVLQERYVIPIASLNNRNRAAGGLGASNLSN